MPTQTMRQWLSASRSYGMTAARVAQAYTALANDGVFTYSRTYSMVKDRSGKIILDNQPQTIQAFSQDTARTMTYMLNNAATYGHRP